MQRLKTLRTQQGLSQYRLAKESGVAQSVISQIEAGRGNPTMRTIDRLAQALGVDRAALLDCDTAMTVQGVS